MIILTGPWEWLTIFGPFHLLAAFLVFRLLVDIVFPEPRPCYRQVHTIFQYSEGSWGVYKTDSEYPLYYAPDRDLAAALLNKHVRRHVPGPSTGISLGAHPALHTWHNQHLP